MRMVWNLFLGISLSTAVFAADPSSSGEAPSKGFGGFLQSIFGGNKEATTNATTPPATNSTTTSSTTATGTNVVSGEVNSADAQAGLKAALQTAFTHAIATLGQTNGFLTNKAVRIPMPSQLNYVEQGLRKIHQDALVDAFEETMNHAAEKAVPAAADVLMQSVKEMSMRDAMSLLSSKSTTAVTDYFQKSASTNLYDKLLPIVQEATTSAGVTSAYKNLMGKMPPSLSFLSKTSLNLDNYVTSKTLDGLFKVAGEEEQRIRENPQARTTELLQKVFGAVMGN